MVIFLIGYMGCGKSKLGRKLAPALGYKLADTDKIIEEGVGKSVADIFAERGEAWFRAQERAVLESFANYPENIIVSTGGGMPCKGDNMELMKQIGITVYLKRTPQNIVSRISEHGRWKRPAIRGMNDEELLAYIEANLPGREPFYSQASLVIDCTAMGDEDIIEHIKLHITQYEKSNTSIL
ncbi:MAG: shikimate kinase [Rikenellaceae bacterium]|nr:shikimate kinase [Rikenellaceae bacterium]